MCGLAGFLTLDNGPGDPEDILTRMASALHHRGPDDSGIWSDPGPGIGFAHKRLSIVDLSQAGHQPMTSASNRYVMVFNGEIYNHLKLRKSLEKEPSLPVWRGHSDTETLLACVESWGVKKTLQECVGMFAFALWDSDERTLVLARDRFGEKPLYYGWQNKTLLFGSELKPMKAHPSFSGEINRDALSLYLRHNYIPTPFSIYDGILKLIPGTYLRFKLNRDKSVVSKWPKPSSYWSLSSVVEREQIPDNGSDSKAVNTLEQMLMASIEQQMIADVPLGAFLSGGIDSSTIVALMQAQSSLPVKTFTIGFHEGSYNEAEYAKEVAAYLGTEHTELYVTPKESMEMIAELPRIYDEPFSDSSQIPTYLISRMTRQHVTVALSGDAGDELFGGYNRYTLGQMIHEKIRWLPVGLRTVFANMIRCVPPRKWDAYLNWLIAILPQRYRIKMLGDRLHKFSNVLETRSLEEMYKLLVSHWHDPDALVHDGKEPLTMVADKAQWPPQLSEIERMMFIDTMTYLPDDILVKVDRAAMAVSLETRVPFLDHRLVEYAWQLPLSLKIRSGQGKWILRQVLYRHIPKKMVERPKMGFAIPIDAWLRGPLRDWAESLLDTSKLKGQGYFQTDEIQKKWGEHLSGHRNWQYHLWDILMFQAWLEKT